MPVFVLTIFEWLPMLISGVQEVAALFEWGKGAIEKMQEEDRDPTADEWLELNNRVAGLRRLLHSDEE